MAKCLSEAYREYIEYQVARRRAEKTVDMDQRVIGRFIKVVGDIQLVNVKPDHVEKYFYGKGGLMGEHKRFGWGTGPLPAIGPATHNAYRARLKAFFQYCQMRGYIKQDVMWKTQNMPIPPRKRQRPAPTTLLALLEAADNERDRAWIAVALNTALRSSEIKAITVGDVDLEAGYMYITIRKTNDEDEVPISEDLDRELRRWLRVYAEAIGRPLESSDYLIPARRGGLIVGYVDGQQQRAPWTYSPTHQVQHSERFVQQALDSLGLPTHYEGTHTLRRAVALAYFNEVAQDQGDVAALRETASLLHHKSLATTEKYLGMTAEKNRRNRRLRGKPFLSAMVQADNVVPLRARAEGE